MNPDLDPLQSYPFEKLAALKADRTPLALYIGEPKHPNPDLISDALTASLHLRTAIAG